MKRLEDNFDAQYKQFQKTESNLQKPNVILYILSGVNYKEFNKNIYPILMQNNSNE